MLQVSRKKIKMYGFKDLFNEISVALTPSDIGGDPTREDMKEIKRCAPQIAALGGSGRGMIAKIKGQPHTYIVGAGRFRIDNGDTVIPL